MINSERQFRQRLCRGKMTIGRAEKDRNRVDAFTVELLLEMEYMLCFNKGFE